MTIGKVTSEKQYLQPYKTQTTRAITFIAMTKKVRRRIRAYSLDQNDMMKT